MILMMISVLTKMAIRLVMAIALRGRFLNLTTALLFQPVLQREMFAIAVVVI